MPGGALMSGGVEMLCTQRVPRSKAPEATGGGTAVTGSIDQLNLW